jgi:four helix bundle protein
MGSESGRSRKYDLEERLTDFAVTIIDIVESLPNTRAAGHIAGQLIRCGTSPAPNYGEAQSAESRKDFIHKIKIALKELRETRVWLKIVERKNLVKDENTRTLLAECDELISIFVTSVKTAERNKNKKSREI